jgi:hypothetical protein
MLCELLDKANEFVGPLLITTTFVNFFFLCERIYKKLLLFHYCANVNFDARRPLEIFREAPQRTWNVVDVSLKFFEAINLK